MHACLFVLAVTVIVAPACGVPGITGASDRGPSPAGSDSPRPVAGGLSFRTIGTGNGFTCALTPAGEAWCWGFNERGELGAGDAITVTRDSSPHKSRPIRVAGGHGFTTLAVGDHHSCALTAEGDAWCWGDNIAGALGSATTQQCVHWFNGNWPCSSTPVRAGGAAPRRHRRRREPDVRHRPGRSRLVLGRQRRRAARRRDHDHEGAARSGERRRPLRRGGVGESAAGLRGHGRR